MVKMIVPCPEFNLGESTLTAELGTFFVSVIDFTEEDLFTQV